jgi:hypothetical protein
MDAFPPDILRLIRDILGHPIDRVFFTRVCRSIHAAVSPAVGPFQNEVRTAHLSSNLPLTQRVATLWLRTYEVADELDACVQKCPRDTFSHIHAFAESWLVPTEHGKTFSYEDNLLVNFWIVAFHSKIHDWILVHLTFRGAQATLQTGVRRYDEVPLKIRGMVRRERPGENSLVTTYFRWLYEPTSIHEVICDWELQGVPSIEHRTPYHVELLPEGVASFLATSL